MRPLAQLGERAAATALRPLNGAVEVAVDAGIDLERRALALVLDSRELERAMAAVIDSPRLQRALRHAFYSEGVQRLVDGFFASGMFDRVVDRLLESEGLWRLIDEVAASPSVTAAIAQQGLSFADQVEDEVRTRSRSADDWLERAAQRLTRRRERRGPVEPDAAGP